MIDINKEHLIPVGKVAAYLESRGLGKRVHPSVVYRWMARGTQGVRLESVRIGGHAVTSVEAIQRWAEARERAREERYAIPTAPTITAAEHSHAEAERFLVEQRFAPTELDEVVEGLSAGAASTRQHVADALFRAGMRSADDVRRQTIDGLLGLPGIGTKFEVVVRELARMLEA